MTSGIGVPATPAGSVGARPRPVVEQLRGQARACAELGSMMYADLLSRAAEDPVPVAAALGDRASLPPDEGMRQGNVLRLLAAVHRLVLAGDAPRLAAHYPSAGGAYQEGAAWPEFRRTLERRRDDIVPLLDTPPQTNEIAYSAALIGGLLHVAARTGLPIALHELGAGAGLNLRADRFRYTYGRGQVYGGGNTPVTVHDAWHVRGGTPPVDAPLRILDRAGCDTDPIDVTTRDGWLRAASYIWPDQTRRFDAFRAACTVAAGVPARLERSGGAPFLADLTPQPGIVTVVWHSVTRQHVDAGEWERVEAALAAASRVATQRAPVAHLSFEPRTTRGAAPMGVTLRLWPGGQPQLLGEGPTHGTPVLWY